MREISKSGMITARLCRMRHDWVMQRLIAPAIAIACAIGFLGALPPIARLLYARPARGERHVTKTLAAIATIRAARRAGQPTLLVAGNSVTSAIRGPELSDVAVAAVAFVPGSALSILTAHSRILIDYADPDILVVPLLWATFTDPPGSDVGDSRLALFGFGSNPGLVTQAAWLLSENVSMFHRSPFPHFVPVDQRIVSYKRSLGIETQRYTTPPPHGLEALDELRRYGADRGVRVLYYLSPHNPAYFADGTVDPARFDEFRAAIRPYLLADLGLLVSPEACKSDFYHVNDTGMHRVALELRDALSPEIAQVRPRAFRTTTAWRAASAWRDITQASRNRSYAIAERIASARRRVMASVPFTLDDPPPQPDLLTD